MINFLFATLKISVCLVVLLFTAGEGFALPPCEGDDENKWQNCEGTVTYKSGNEYFGEWKGGKRFLFDRDRRDGMPKGYMISAHRSEADPVKRAAYLKTAASALEGAGGIFLAKAGRVEARENGVAGRTILIEFESYDAAIAAYESEAYQEALRALDGGADRDIRLFEGVD